MRHSLRRRMTVAAALLSLLWVSLAGLFFLALESQFLPLWVMLPIGAVVGAGVSWLVLFGLMRPIQQDLLQLERQLGQGHAGLDSARAQWLTADVQQAVSPLAGWQHAYLDLQVQAQSLQDELQQAQQRLVTLQRVLHQIHVEGQSPAQAVAQWGNTWQDDPEWQALMAPLQSSQEQLVASVQGMTQVVDRNSTTLAELAWQAKSISEAMNMLAASGTQAASASQTLSENAIQVSQQATQVGALARQAQDNSRQGQVELQQTMTSMRTMGAHTQEVSGSITRLQDSSRKIEHMAQLIREIADKINLLSLNAAIEAARAGEHGRGFAVVAQEVNNLAEKTFNATQEIDATVSGILSETGHAVHSINTLLTDVQDNVQHIDQVGQRLTGILEFSSVLTQQMDGIVSASEQSARQVQGISGYLGDIRTELHSFGQRIQTQESQIVGLTELGEGFFDNLIELRFDSTHRRMFRVARAAADAVGQVFEQAVAQGQIRREDLLSADYEPIAHTNPPKFNSRFDAFCDRVLPAVQEEVLRNNPSLVFAICTDKRGYVPTHNDKFAKPPTGDYATDLVQSRSKRIFADRTGSRCGAHTKKMLLQTYKRDTGEIMHDLSVPIYIGGVHWGGFRMGYQAH